MSEVPPVKIEPAAQRLDTLFRHVLQSAEGHHLWQLMQQYRKEATP